MCHEIPNVITRMSRNTQCNHSYVTKYLTRASRSNTGTPSALLVEHRSQRKIWQKIRMLRVCRVPIVKLRKRVVVCTTRRHHESIVLQVSILIYIFAF